MQSQLLLKQLLISGRARISSIRKAISQTLALTLILSLAGTSFIAHAAVKAGSSCSKAEMSSVIVLVTRESN